MMVGMEAIDLIPNRKLTLAHVPAYDVTILDPQNFNGGWTRGRSDEEWVGLWRFALTFDGYGDFGGDATAGERLAEFDRSVEDAFRRDGVLPRLDLRMLRACLFIQQRRWCKGDVETQRCPPESGAYLQALLAAIRRAVGG